ncbi:Copper-exporting P-type ATPase B [Rothia kristinae]|nr:Copper-exporting P-type ATPase B [Rothia kristinae]
MTDPNAHQHHHGDTADAPAHSGHAVATTAPGHGEDPHAGHAGHAHQGQHGDHAGHGGHGGHGDHVGQFRRLFWINLVIAAPVVGLSPMFAMLLGYSVPGWAGWVAAVLGTVMYVWGGKPFLTGAWSELRSRKPGMMLLIALAITVAFFASWAATLGLVHHELEFWWELALLIVIMLLGHWIEMRSLAQTTSALDSLAALLPDEAERVEGDDIVKVDPAELRVGDVVIVRPGGSVPADGTVVDGHADMDESMITGESRPVARGEGDPVTAGTVATDSGLRVEITATGDDTALAGINRLVAEAQGSSSRAQRIADRAAAWLFWFALGAALITAIVWTLAGSPDDAVVRTITVLVIACPHALGLAIPLVVSIATERAARGGVLVKDRLALESMRQVDAVLFDKTGTLTRGEPTVTGVEPTGDLDANQVLALAASAEADSEHPLARAIVAAAKDRGLALQQATGFSSSPRRRHSDRGRPRDPRRRPPAARGDRPARN